MAVKLGEKAAYTGRTFEEMIAPLKEYATAYNAVEQQYDNLAMNANLIKQMIESEPNESTAKATYNAYLQGLNGAVDDFSRGMNMANRAALTGLKRGYARDVVPINQAVEAKKKLVQQADSISGKDANDIVWQKHPDAITLDELIANPAMGLGKRFSKSQVTNYVGGLAQSLTEQVRDILDRVIGASTSTTTNTLGTTTTTSQKHERYQNLGYTEEEVLDAMKKIAKGEVQDSDENALYTIYREGLKYADVDGLRADDPMRQAAERAIADGLLKAMKFQPPIYYDISRSTFTPSGLYPKGKVNGLNQDDITHTYNPHAYYMRSELAYNNRKNSGKIALEVIKAVLRNGSLDENGDLTEAGKSAVGAVIKGYYNNMPTINSINDVYDLLTINGKEPTSIDDLKKTIAKNAYWTQNIPDGQIGQLQRVLSSASLNNEEVQRFEGIDEEGKPRFKPLQGTEQETWGRFLARMQDDDHANKEDVINQISFWPGAGIMVSVQTNKDGHSEWFLLPSEINQTLYNHIMGNLNTLYDSEGNQDKQYKQKLADIYAAAPSLWAQEGVKTLNNGPTYGGEIGQAYGGYLDEQDYTPVQTTFNWKTR